MKKVLVYVIAAIFLLTGCSLEDVDERVEAKKSMLDSYPNLRAMYDENDDNTAVFYFKDATATFASFGGAPEVVKF